MGREPTQEEIHEAIQDHLDDDIDAYADPDPMEEFEEERMAITCLVCGGDHEPHPTVCDPAGTEKQTVKLGARKMRWLTRPLMTDELREWLRKHCKD